MKKFITVTLIVLIVFWILIKVFSLFNSHTVLSNQAVFQVYSDMEANEIDKSFNLPEGTFDLQKHLIMCKLPVNTTGFKPGFTIVKFKAIDCNEAIDMERLVKYDNSELIRDDNRLQLFIVKSGTPMVAFNESLHRDNIIGSRVEEFKYSRGKINYVMLSKDSVFDYCK